MAQSQQPLHLRPPQIEVPVLEPDGLRDVRVVLNHKGRCLGLIQNLHSIGEHLDLSSRQLRVLGFIRPSGHHPADGHDTLGAQRMRCMMNTRVPFSVKHHLGHAGSIPEVDEDQAPVIAAPLHPSHQMHALADFRAPKLPAHMRSRLHDASFSRLAATAFT